MEYRHLSPGIREAGDMNVFEESWSFAYFVGFLAYLRIRAVYAQRCKYVARAHRQVDLTEKLLLLLVIPSSTLLPILYLFTPLLAFADHRLPGWAPWCGGGVMLFALWLFWRSHADLGENWSVSLEVRTGHQMVSQGVYRRIRHPMYAAIWLWSAAQAMLLPNWIAGWSALITFAPMYFIRTPREERMLCQFLGQEYRDYMRQTGRLLPRVQPIRAGTKGATAEARESSMP
jgi:protein-S-isoprenylcysteine O-methyltransferase Ste14